MRAFFIIYEQDGKIGNDFISGAVDPYRWLLESLEKYPDSAIAMHSFQEVNVRPEEFDYYNERIGIDVVNRAPVQPEAAKEPEVVVAVTKPAIKTVEKQSFKKKKKK